MWCKDTHLFHTFTNFAHYLTKKRFLFCFVRISSYLCVLITTNHTPMKKIFLMTFVALFTATTSYAQKTQDPKGLYRLKQFIYEGGRTAPAEYSQYKYAADSVGLLISYRPYGMTTRWNSMQVEIRESYPLKYTGEKPQGADGHGTQIFNVDDEQFLFKWYNDKYPRMSNLNEFITEVYRKSAMEPEVVEAFNMLENKIDYKANKFCGWWLRIAATADPNGTGKRQQVPIIWKVYSPKQSMVVHPLNNGNVLGFDITNTVKYDNDSLIYEVGHPCNIKWLNDDTHALTFVQENGQPLTEIWVRAGLPKQWQDIFHTNLETYRNGVDCIKEAIETVTQGDLQKSEALIDEAINDKGVAMEPLGMGIAAIATYLYSEKQQYKECLGFCERQLQKIKDYTEAGNDQNIFAKLHVHLTEVFRALATYRSGDTEKGLKLMKERLSIVDSEIERYKAVKGMESYINLLYYCNLMMYNFGYDVFGAEQTLLYLDALSLMAPTMTSAPQNKTMILKCRANCYLLKGDKESADKLLKQAEEVK